MLPAQDELRLVLNCVCAADALNAALACRAFKIAIFSRDWPHQKQNKRRITTLRDVVASVPALQQARSLGCPWDARVCTAAATEGKLAVLKFAISQGLAIDTNAIKAAAQHRHLHVLKELRSIGCPWHPDTTASAASTGDLELIKWIVADDAPWASATCFAAAGSGCVEVLAWAREHGAPFTGVAFGGCYDYGCDIFVSVHGGGSMYGIAARNGHIEMLEWLRSQDVPWPKDEGYYGSPDDISDGLYACAARGGHLEVIEWLERHGIEHSDHGDEVACEAAAAGGHLQLLRWLRSRSPPYKWDQATCKAAAANGHLDVLRWATENGAPWKRYWGTNNEKSEWCTDMVNEAVQGGHLKCLKWIFDHGFPRSIPKDPNPAMVSIAMGHKDTADELAYMGMCAYDRGQTHVLQWLQENGFPMDFVEERKKRTSPGGDLYRDDGHYEHDSSFEANQPGGFIGPGSRLKFAKRLDSSAELQPGRLGAVIRGEYVIVVKCNHSFCNCHVAVFWKDEADTMHRDCEEMFKSSLDHVISELIPQCGGAYSEYSNALGEPSATDLARGVVDLRVAELASISMLQSEFWSAVRMYLDAAAAGIDSHASDLPKCFVRFMKQATDGRIVKLTVEGEEAACAAIHALGGTWPNAGQRPSVQW